MYGISIFLSFEAEGSMLLVGSSSFSNHIRGFAAVSISIWQWWIYLRSGRRKIIFLARLIQINNHREVSHIATRVGEVVGCVEQNAWLITVDFHGAARGWMDAACDESQTLGGTRGDAEVVVVAVARGLRNGFAQLASQTKVETCVADVEELPSWDLFVRDLQDLIGVHGELVLRANSNLS